MLSCILLPIFSSLRFHRLRSERARQLVVSDAMGRENQTISLDTQHTNKMHDAMAHTTFSYLVIVHSDGTTQIFFLSKKSTELNGVVSKQATRQQQQKQN